MPSKIRKLTKKQALEIIRAEFPTKWEIDAQKRFIQELEASGQEEQPNETP